MKAVVLKAYGSRDVLCLQEIRRPEPGPGQVRVRVHAASVNDWDWALMRGSPIYIRLLAGPLEPRVKIPGVDVAGVVDAVGDGVVQHSVGDRVYGDLSENGFGAFAEYVCTDEDAVARMPDEMSFVQGAALPNAAMLAIQGLVDYGRLGPGQRLLINGAGGGVGTIGLQIARSLGVSEVAGVDHGSKLEAMRSVGFQEVIDYRSEDFTRRGERYDLILDTKTTRSPWRYLRALRPGGAYVTVGGSTVRLLQCATLGRAIGPLTGKRVAIVPLVPNKDLAMVNALFAAGRLRALTEGPYPLEDIEKAVQHFGSGAHIGKVIVTTSAEAGV